MRLAEPIVPGSGDSSVAGLMVSDGAGLGVRAHRRRGTLGAGAAPRRFPSTGGRRRLPDPHEHADVDTTGKLGYWRAGRGPKENKKARGQSGKKESGFARLPRCRPAESDLARSARKSKKSYWARISGC